LDSRQKQIEHYERATRGAWEGLWVAEPTRGMRWPAPECPTWYSPQFLRLLGYEEAEFPGVLGSWNGLLHPHDRGTVLEVLTHAVIQRLPFHVTGRLQLKSGQYQSFQIQGAGAFDSHGALVSVGGTLRGIHPDEGKEETLRQKHALWDAVLEGISEVVFAKDSEGRYALVNAAGAALIGKPVERIIGKTDQELFGERLHPLFGQMDSDVIHEGRAQTFEVELHEQQTVSRVFLVTKEPFGGAEGDGRGVLGFARDITQRKQSEDSLEAMVKGSVISGSPNFFEILVGELAKVLHVPMVLLFERLQGYHTKTRILAFWNHDHFDPPSEYDCEGGPCERVLEGYPVNYASGVQQLFPRSTTLKRFAVESYVGCPLINSKNEVVGNLALMNTQRFQLSSQGQYLLEIFAARAGTELERKRSQEELQKSQEQYRALYDQTPLIYLTVDERGRILSVNQYGAHALGYETSELLGTSVCSVVYPEDREMFQTVFEKTVRDCGKGVISEFRKVKKDGSLLWVKETIQTTDQFEGARVLLLSCEDITERKRTEAALVSSEKQLRHTQKMEAMGTLAGGIAHDFNNILGAILGYSELAMAQGTHDLRLKSYLQEVLAAGQRARDLVKQILTFSRRSERDREAVDLQMVVRDVLGMIRASFPASIDIRMSGGVDSAVIYADPSQMQQVVMNLCANAEYAMRDHGGRLEISLTYKDCPDDIVEGTSKLKAGPYVQLGITDTGKGMAPDTVERIFEPFFTTKKAGEGTGLGLAVVHGIVHNHGGAIRVSSMPGFGTTFTLLFPRLDVVVPVKPEEVLDWPTGSGKILFVDDEEMLMRWGEQLLTHLGYSVVSTMNPYEALAWFRETPWDFDVVVTDQTMPTMSGDALSRELLRIRPNIPILLCTGFSHSISAEKAKALGIRTFLMKPVNGKSLAFALREILDQSLPPEPFSHSEK